MRYLLIVGKSRDSRYFAAGLGRVARLAGKKFLGS